MKYLIISLFCISFFPVVAEESSVILTPFDILLSEDDFTTQGPNHNILVLQRGQSATITITLENNDDVSHQITLKDPRPTNLSLFDSFVFEPEQLNVLPHQKNSTKLHLTISEDTDVHTSFITFLAQSKDFGMKGIGFYLMIDEGYDELVDKSLRSGLPGSMFPHIDTQISEDDAAKMIDIGFGIPIFIPKDYQFRGMTDWGDSKQFVYSTSPVVNSTESFDFWKDGGMLITYYNFIDRPNVNNTKSLPVRIAQDEGQQVMINGMMGMAIEKQTRVVMESDIEYDVAAEVEFFDDAKRASVSLNANTPLDDLLKIASSIPIYEKIELIPPPLKQSQAGVDPYQIRCKLDFRLVHKFDGTPACVNDSHRIELQIRGWATFRINPDVIDAGYMQIDEGDGHGYLYDSKIVDESQVQVHSSYGNQHMQTLNIGDRIIAGCKSETASVDHTYMLIFLLQNVDVKNNTMGFLGTLESWPDGACSSTRAREPVGWMDEWNALLVD